MTCAAGISKEGIARSYNGVAVTECDGAPCCCEPACFHRYDPCPGAPCDTPVFMPCNLQCQDGGPPDVIIWKACCYIRDATVKYVFCPPGEPPPDGFECLPEGAETPNIGDVSCVENCDSPVCSSCFVRAVPCPGTDPTPIVLVACEVFEMANSDCFVFTFQGGCYYANAGAFKVSGCDSYPDEECVEVTSPPQIVGTTCCDCPIVPDECEKNTCQFLGPLPPGIPTPPALECCCEPDEQDKQWKVIGFEKSTQWSCLDCPPDCSGGDVVRTIEERTTFGSEATGELVCQESITQFHTDCDTCTSEFNFTDTFESVQNCSVLGCCPTFCGLGTSNCVGRFFDAGHACEETVVGAFVWKCNVVVLSWHLKGYDGGPDPCGDCTFLSEEVAGYYVSARSLGVCGSGCNEHTPGADLGAGPGGNAVLGTDDVLDLLEAA